MLNRIPLKVRIQVVCAVFTLGMLFYAHSMLRTASAQEGGPSAETTATPEAPPPADDAAPPAKKDNSLSLLRLYLDGGIFMYPLTLLSIVSVVAAIERGLALRRSRVIPDGLVTGLGQLGTSPGGFDPRKAFRVCQQYPSAAANVVRTMLLRVGRPLPEIEAAVNEASNREATKLYHNARWLNLAASIGTMIGLLGTIQGMIIAFHRLTNLAQGSDKITVLSSGIYTALVTTFAGLCVAIPAVMVAHYFEGKIQRMFDEIHDLVQSLLPQAERYEGRVRFGKQEEASATEPLVASN
jgi:biopolymer transport protein ExbB